MLPAPAQGALAVECRADRPRDRLVRGRSRGARRCRPSRAAVTAERALLAALEAGCSAPVGAQRRRSATARSRSPARSSRPMGGAQVRGDRGAGLPARRPNSVGELAAAHCSPTAPAALLGDADDHRRRSPAGGCWCRARPTGRPTWPTRSPPQGADVVARAVPDRSSRPPTRRRSTWRSPAWPPAATPGSGFTSVNALRAVTRRAAAARRSIRSCRPTPGWPRSAPAPRGPSATAGLPVDLVPGTGGSAAALAALWPHGRPATPCCCRGRTGRRRRCRTRCPPRAYRVDAVVAYATGADALGETSRRAARRLDRRRAAHVAEHGRAVARHRRSRTRSCCWGRSAAPTADAIRAAGLRPAFVAARPGAAGLVDALVAFVTGR